MAASVAEEFAHRLSLCQAQDEARLKWMNDVYTQLAELSSKYKDSCNDLERERIAGRETQKRAAEFERQFQVLRQTVDDSSFVLVLIDADADSYMFKDQYYSDHDGGRRAACDLQARVKDYLAQEKPHLVRLPILIRAFVNGDGMSQVLGRAGLMQPSGSLWDFGKAFSQAHATSDFIFVGNGKDRADKKIKSAFEQFVKNPTCRHIMLGACHDNGYVRMLEDFAGDSDVVERVTLLYSFSVGQEFKRLRFRSTKMEDIFRTASPASSVTATAVRAQEAPKVRINDTAVSKTWAALAGIDQQLGKTSVISKSTSLPGRKVLVNAVGHRVDEELPQPSPAATKIWMHKTQKAGMRYCRAYQLNGSCPGGCEYSHGPLSVEEKFLYRRLLREEKCHVGLECRDINCYYGHNCTCKKRRSCKHPKKMHDIDATTAKVWEI